MSQQHGVVGGWHGKGLCDGVGGALKRKADALIKQKKVISNADEFYEDVKESGTKIVLIKATSDEVEETKKRSFSVECTMYKRHRNYACSCTNRRSPTRETYLMLPILVLHSSGKILQSLRGMGTNQCTYS